MANFSLFARMGLDTSAFQSGINGAKKSSQGFGSALSALRGPLAALGLGAVGRSAMNLGERITNLSVQLNTNAESLQALQGVTKDTGATQGALERALRNVQQRTQQAINGNKGYQEAFERLNINVKEFNKLPTERRLEAIAKAQANATDKASAFNDVSRILGERAGPELQGVLKSLANEGFDGLSERMSKSGRIMSTEAAAAAEKLSTQFGALKDRVTILVGEGFRFLTPAVGILATGFGVIADAVRGFFRQLNALGTLLGEVLYIGVQPLIAGLQILGNAARAAGLAIRGNFTGAKEALDEANQGVKDLAGVFAQSAKDMAKAGGAFVDDTKDNFGEMFNDIADRNDKFEESWDDLMEAFGKGGQDASRKAADAFDVVGEAGFLAGIDAARGMDNAAMSAADIAKAAAAAEKELQKLADVKMSELNSDLKGIDSELQGIEKEIAATKERILELNQQDLNELASKFGTTAEAIKNELDRQIRAGGKDAGEMSAKELEAAMQRAIGQIRSNLRRAGEEVKGVMPSSAELAELGRLFGVVAAQSSVLATAPDSVELLTEKYEELVARAKELNAMRTDIQQELGDLKTGMESTAEALTDASSEIQQIPFDIKDALKDITMDTDTFAKIENNLDKTVDQLKKIESILRGKFVNQ